MTDLCPHPTPEDLAPESITTQQETSQVSPSEENIENSTSQEERISSADEDSSRPGIENNTIESEQTPETESPSTSTDTPTAPGYSVPKKKHHILRWILIILAIPIVAVLVIAAWFWHNGKNFFETLHPNQMKVEQTTLINEIQQIAELTTVCYYKDQVVKGKRPSSRLLSTSPDVLILLMRGKVRAGFDLTHLTENDITLRGDTLFLQLPPAQITDIVTNPTDCQVLIEDGRWSQYAVERLQHEGREQLRQSALNSNLLEKARHSGVATITTFLQSMGYSNVQVVVRD